MKCRAGTIIDSRRSESSLYGRMAFFVRMTAAGRHLNIGRCYSQRKKKSYTLAGCLIALSDGLSHPKAVQPDQKSVTLVITCHFVNINLVFTAFVNCSWGKSETKPTMVSHKRNDSNASYFGATNLEPRYCALCGECVMESLDLHRYKPIASYISHFEIPAQFSILEEHRRPAVIGPCPGYQRCHTGTRHCRPDGFLLRCSFVSLQTQTPRGHLSLT